MASRNRRKSSQPKAKKLAPKLKPKLAPKHKLVPALTSAPALSDDEQSDIELVQPDIEVPLREKRVSKSADVDEGNDSVTNGAAAAEDEEDDEEDDEEGDEEKHVGRKISFPSLNFIVEKILDHKVDANGDITFRVKWEGWEKKSDQTWEPEENLAEGAAEILEEYYTKLGGRSEIIEQTEKARATKKRGRPSTGTPTTATKRRKNGAHPADGTPPASATSNASWKPPSGSWEDDVDSIDACEDEDTGKLIVYLNWKNGHKTKHTTDVIYKRCPQKMLQFYEKHIRIIKNAPLDE